MDIACTLTSAQLRARRALECCPFLTLDLRRAGGHVVLTIIAPNEAAPIIADLFA
jgi:hypothetical protein